MQLTKQLPDLTEDHLRELGLPMGAQPTNNSPGCNISPNLPCEVDSKPNRSIQEMLQRSSAACS
jgi:hypothetical protein